MDSERIYKVALSMTQGVTAEVVRSLESRGISLRDFFTMNMPDLQAELSLERNYNFQNAYREEALAMARKEMEFINKHSIRTLFISDEDYPILLKETPDAPVMLYVLGNADLNSQPLLSVVGTRRCTAYGTSFCKSFINDLSVYFPDATVVSGLAYGIDAASHISSIESGLKTMAVMAHGLDTIYPSAHRDLARRIIASGGAIVSEYPSKTRPYQRNFLQRNRIVAGLCEATVVVESEQRGGAMSTANLAFSYSREVFAVPGRYSDQYSAGCNQLISRNKAHIFTTVADFMNIMNWKIPAIGMPAPKKSLFPELSGEMALVFEAIRKKGNTVAIDELHQKTGLSMPALMSALTDLEFEGVIVKLPGARYEIC